jgi:hypothetical protein
MTITKTQLESLLSALIRMEHKTTGSVTPDEYWAIVALAQECEAPSFITEYFALKANTQGE